MDVNHHYWGRATLPGNLAHSKQRSYACLSGTRMMTPYQKEALDIQLKLDIDIQIRILTSCPADRP